MRSGTGYWSVFVAFGALIWLAGHWTHPVYRLVLMLAVFSWFGYLARTPKTA